MAAGQKLLVADDSLTIQKVIRLALSNEGYEIQAISDGADAIQQIATFRPDCVLIDVSLPTRTAFEIKREVNSMPDHSGIKFILMSSAFEKIDETQATEVGFEGRLTKPFDPAHLRQILTEVLNAPTAPKSFPNVPPTLPEEPVFTSTGIMLEPPKDFPPSDFEVPQPPSALPSETLPNDDDELWGRHEEPAAALPPLPPAEAAPPAFLSEPSANPSERDEIKQLTESTIRMSGLADVQIQNDEFDWKVNEPSLKPPSSFSDVGGSAFQVGQELPLSPPPLPQNGATAKAPDLGFSASQMEEIVRSQLRETLEKMAQQILPEVAERVIKAEIHKLLNEKL